jgi:hypothetical protein
MKIEKKEKDEIPDEIKNILATNDDLDNEYLIPEDNIYIGKGLGNINEPRHIAPAHAHTHAGYATSEPVNMNTAIIEKALKNTTKPQFNVTVNWMDYPERQIEMLKDVMDIPEEDILDWYLDNIEMLEIVEAVKEGIRNRILFKESQSITVENTPIVEEKPITTVENTPVTTEHTLKKPISNKVKPTTKNTVKKTPVKKSQPKKS